jgi:hypothetical protein
MAELRHERDCTQLTSADWEDLRTVKIHGATQISPDGSDAHGFYFTYLR